MKFWQSLILVITIPFGAVAQQKSNQISLRLGEPLGVGYRRLVNQSNAFEVNIGTGSGKANGRYYRTSFYTHNDLEDHEYTDHIVTDIIFIGSRYTWRKKIIWDSAPGRFEWYYGAGILFKKATVVYGYDEGGSGVVFKTKGKRDIDVGPEGVIGIEYTLQEVPLTIYLETGPFMELANRVAVFRGFMAFGIRFNF